ncbi:MAG: transcriptional regulator [Planctomycetes bacterium]|nr:transcriptional regulator [Planctomycetota bacterium]
MPESRLTDAKRALLELIKRQGPTDAACIAKKMKLTDVAVRQHLAVLEEKGLVMPTLQPPKGRGRPTNLWRLTQIAIELFPDRHADLTVDLINATRKALGEESLLRVIEVRAQDQIKSYRKLVPTGGSLKKRVEALAKLRSAEGYMAEVIKEKPGTYLLIEHHCPICEAAKTCQGLCAAELDVFKSVLGRGVRIERCEHLLSKGDRCIYRIQDA